MEQKMVSTAFDIPGYKIVESFGKVSGASIRTRDFFGNISESIKAMGSAKSRLYNDLCEGARNEAYRELLKNAEELGADAIIGVRWDSNSILDGINEIFVYGTAVKAEPV